MIRTTPPSGGAAPFEGEAPFVLLDDARGAGAVPARLYRAPVDVLRAYDPADVPRVLDRLRAASAAGLHAAGFLAYEAGAAFEPHVVAPVDPALPLAWFGLFEGVERIDAEDVPNRLPDGGGGWCGPPVPAVEYDAYDDAIERVLAAIRAGDIYQANVTFQAQVAVAGHPLALYAALRARARAGYGGVVWTGTHWLLSASPELFFSLREGRIVARPMKGTARRRTRADADAMARAELASDPKQRAENLMIVDLIRNDLSRVAVPGSVRVPALFRVETYPTVHQMVSDVTATAAPGVHPCDVLAATFPCGSITGAPKIRAQQIIAGVEAGPRGVYTGSIGFIAPDGEAAFNVAIRTLVLQDGAATAQLGLGSGIVADSRGASEWSECLAKGAFVTAGQAPFDILETLAFDPVEGAMRLDEHLARMRDAAQRFGRPFDRHAVRNLLQAATFRQRDAARIRIRLAPDGAVAVAVEPAPAPAAGVVDVRVVPLPVDAADWRLRFKTSARGFYDAARTGAGTFEVLFVDAAGFLTEGSFTNLFVPRGDVLVTPPATRGLLPGVLRATLLAEGRAVEGDLRPADLADGFLIGNSLRGLIPARLANG